MDLRAGGSPHDAPGGPCCLQVGCRVDFVHQRPESRGGLPELCGAAQLLAYERVRKSPELSKWEVLTSRLGLDLCSLNPQVGIHIARLPQEEKKQGFVPFPQLCLPLPHPPPRSCTAWGPDPEKLTRLMDGYAGRVQELAVSPPCWPPGLPSAGEPCRQSATRLQCDLLKIS